MRIVCLEGCSGAGKTTQYYALDNHYRNENLRHLAVIEKNYEPFKTAVKEWHEAKGPSVPFEERDIRRFAEARAKTFLDNFFKLNRNLDLMFLDRYFYTSAVYQRNSGLSPKEILQINIDYGAPIPDLTFLFDCEPHVCFSRASKRNKLTGGKHLFSKNTDKVKEIREQYLKLAKGRKEVRIIKTNRSISDITNDLIEQIEKIL